MMDYSDTFPFVTYHRAHMSHGKIFPIFPLTHTHVHALSMYSLKIHIFAAYIPIWRETKRSYVEFHILRRNGWKKCKKNKGGSTQFFVGANTSTVLTDPNVIKSNNGIVCT